MRGGIHNREAMAGRAGFPIERDESGYAGGIDAIDMAEIEHQAFAPNQGGEAAQQAFFATPDKFGQSAGDKCNCVVRDWDCGGHHVASFGEAGFKRGACLRLLLHLLCKQHAGGQSLGMGNMLKSQGIGAFPNSVPPFRVFNRSFERPQMNT